MVWTRSSSPWNHQVTASFTRESGDIYRHSLVKNQLENTPSNNTFCICIMNFNEIVNDIYTMSCPFKVKSNTSEPTTHTSCYCVLDSLCVTSSHLLIKKLEWKTARLYKWRQQNCQVKKFVKNKNGQVTAQKPCLH